MSVDLNALLEKASHWDKDERYMATNDLCNALSRDITIDERMEQRICTAVLTQLDDQSNDVQSVAVKCLAVLLKKVQQAQIGAICKKLCSLTLDGKDELRDIYSIGLKTLIADVPDVMGPIVVEQLSSRVLRGISSSDSENVVRECLDIMSDLLKRFGHLNEKNHHDIMSTIVKQLDHPRSIIQKRAGVCLASLSVVSSDALLNNVIQVLLDKTESGTKESRMLIQTIGTIARTVGYRLGKHLQRIIPLFLRFCGDPEDESQQTEAYNELRESCFPGLESFVLRCPQEVTPFLKDILAVSISFMKFDPNYAYDEDDDDAEMEVDGEDEEEYEDEDFGGSDDDNDDDGSWKVRKAAVKVIVAIIQTHPEKIVELYDVCGHEILNRFKEREESVRNDVIFSFSTFLQAISNLQNQHKQILMKNDLKSGSTVVGGDDGDMMEVTSSTDLLMGKLGKHVSIIVKVSEKQISGRSNLSKSAVLSLLKLLVNVLNDSFETFIPQCLLIVEKCLLDKNQALRLDALILLKAILDKCNLQKSDTLLTLIRSQIPTLLPIIGKIVQENWYKIIAEALRVMNSFILILRPKNIPQAVPFDSTVYIPIIYEAVSSRLDSLDIDQEIKECAILTAGRLIAIFGDLLIDSIPSILDVYQKRLENETTRTATLKAILIVTDSSFLLNINDFFVKVLPQLTQFLRLNNRMLKQLTLQALDSLVLSQSTTLMITQQGDITSLLQGVEAVISDTDIHLTHIGLKLTLSLLHKNHEITTTPLGNSGIYLKMLKLAQSSLIQGQALQSLIKLFQDLASIGHSSFQQLFQDLYITPSQTVGTKAEIQKQGMHTLSKCVAGICTNLSADEIRQILGNFDTDLRAKKGNSTESAQQLALLCLGDVGEKCLFSNSSVGTVNMVPANLKQLLLSYFESSNSSEDTKLAAAYALGHLAVGDMQEYLPMVLQTVQSPRHQYLLFAALKEIIIVYANLSLDFSPYLDQVVPMLLQQSKAAEEESVRNMVAECLGVLTTLNSTKILPLLLKLASKVEDKPQRRISAQAVRFALARQQQQQKQQNRDSPSSLAMTQALLDIRREIHQFLPLLEDEDLDVKKEALTMVNTAAHHCPYLLDAHYSSVVLPALLDTLKIKLERVVDLGPFKHKVDDNLPLRIVSLTCLQSILESQPADRVDTIAVAQILPLLLADKDEIKQQTYQMLIKLCSYAPQSLLSSIELLIVPLGKTIEKKISREAGAPVGPEVERALELIRSALRAVLVVETGIPELSTISRKWVDFTERLRRDEQIAGMISAIENEKTLEG